MIRQWNSVLRSHQSNFATLQGAIVDIDRAKTIIYLLHVRATDKWYNYNSVCSKASLGIQSKALDNPKKRIWHSCAKL